MKEPPGDLCISGKMSRGSDRRGFLDAIGHRFDFRASLRGNVGIASQRGAKDNKIRLNRKVERGP